MSHRPFKSFFMGGFECSTHRRYDGKRLDLIAATRHDRWVDEDYQALARLGIATMREGLRWHLIEQSPRIYDWSSCIGALEAADRNGAQIIWDMCHYGWPDDIDIWSQDFVDRFAAFAGEAAAFIASRSEGPVYFCPINEISFWAWAGGKVGYLNPHAIERGDELKLHLCRAAVAATKAIRRRLPDALFITAEPLINVTTGYEDPVRRGEADAYRLSQFETTDYLTGAKSPDIVQGHPELVDYIGLNFYPENQWYFEGAKIPFGHHHFRPLGDMLLEVFHRYRKPLLIAETGAEGSSRAAWLYYVCQEVDWAIARGVPVLGICIYPVIDYPGWDNDRICAAGLLSVADASGARAQDEIFVAELQRQQQRSCWM